jgi:ribosomal subunit interface protein
MKGVSGMDIIFKGRRTDVQERFRSYASAKLSRITKLAHKAIRVDVEVSAERNPRQSGRRERVELTILSRGPAIRAEAAADDRFAALDRALAKLEERLRRSGDRRKSARHGAPSAGRIPSPRSAAAAADLAATRAVPSYAEASPWDLGAPGPSGNGAEPGQRGQRAEPAADEDLAEEAAGVVPIQMEGDGPVVVREKFHAAAPVSVDQALFEMELVGHDFYLFRDEQCGLPSVVYRRHGYQYGLIRLVEQTQPGVAANGGLKV